jgi:Ni/Co efflux regulator RcnB
MLLALPVLAAWFNSGLALPRRGLRWLAVGGFLLLISLDNASWFGMHVTQMARGEASDAFLLSDDTGAVLHRLAVPEMAGRLILSDEDDFAYLAVVYDHSRAWKTHGDNTPRRRQREQELADLFTTGAEVAEWRQRPVVVVYGGGDPRVVARLRGDFSQVETIGHYTLLTR